jgi:hypothetical protein
LLDPGVQAEPDVPRAIEVARRADDDLAQTVPEKVTDTPDFVRSKRKPNAG